MRKSRTLGLAVVLALKVHTPVTAQAPAGHDQLREHFRAGQADMQSGRFDAAIAEFKRVLELEPDLPEARLNLGLAYQAAGDYRLAASELSRVAKQRPDLMAANLFLGISYLKLGSPEKAVAPLSRAVSIDPADREARRALANAELAQGEYGEAAAQFRTLAATQSDKADAWFTLGQDYLEIAKPLIARLSADYRTSAWAERMAGDVLAQRHLWNDAGFAYRQALTTEPAQPGLDAALGEALLAAGKMEEAEAEFKRELSRNPLEPTALLRMAEVDLLRDDPAAALESIAKVWSTAPGFLLQADFPLVGLAPQQARQMAASVEDSASVPARDYVLAALLRASGDEERARQARASFERAARSAITLKPEPGGGSRASCESHQERLCADYLARQKQLPFGDLLRLGRAWLLLGEDEPASDALARALAQRKTSPEAIYWLSRSYLRLGDDCFDQLTASYPDSWRAHELKGEAFHIRQADKDALVEYRAAERLNPADPKIHEALGELLLTEKAPDEAKAELEKALHLNPSAARSLYLMGRLYAEQREPASAIPYLEAALRYDPTLLEARPVLGKAYLKAGKPALAARQLEQSAEIDRYGDLHYMLYQAYRETGKPQLAAQALARSQELRRKSAADDQAKIRPANEE